MSQEMMDPELFADFIVEAREHLETIEPNLLELEKAPDNLALLNDIFRPMHSLKGASGFLGLNRINKLAHRAENILDALRKGSMVVTSEIMDVILSSTDALRQMIDNLDASSTEGDVAVDHLVEQIDNIMAGGSASPAPEPQAAPAPVVEEAPVQEEPAAPEPVMQEEVAPVASASPAENVQDNSETTPMSAKEWIASLPNGEPYTLTAFGEDHLKDFIDEAGEIIENLNTGLLALEENPTGQDDLVNDIFRYFHNLKGNSGIIGYNELNALTHEAETLLNKVRKGEITPSHELIDLSLLVVDMMDALVQKIDISTTQATGFDTSPVVKKLQEAINGGAISLPEELLAAQGRGVEQSAPANAQAESAPACVPVGTEQSDSDAFAQTIKQQMAIIQDALKKLSDDGTLKDSIDNLYRSLTVVRNACGAVGQEEIKVYAERTAGIVDQGRKSDLDFSMMVDMMSQEVGIIDEMIQKAIAEGKIALESGPSASAAPASEAPAQQPAAAAPKPAPAQESASAPAAAPAPAATKAPAAPAPATQEAKSAPAPKPAAPAAPTAAAKPAAPAPAQQAAKPAQAAQAPAKEHKGSSTIRVDQWRLDHLMNSIGELIINRNRYTLIARSLENASENINIAEVAQDLSETTYAMARISDDLQDTIMKVRMVPVSSVFSRFPRLVRDLSRKSGKEVDLIMEGEETELDKSVVEVIGDPLVHLIRNSVDHGIEPEADRIAAGKPAKGKVTLRAFHKGNSVAIEVEDDGKGIDPEKMREVAVRKGIISQEEAAQLDDREARELIFAPGFSSAEKITDISGRGVGMDVVRTNIKNLKGSVNTNSEIGKGTKFTLSLPLTLAIIDALMVNVQGQMYAIPLDAVAETTKIESARLTDVKGRKAVTLRGDVLGIVELSEMLGLPAAETLPEMLSVVVIHDNDRRLGLVVDQLLERQEIVIKPLGAYLGDLQGISGATIMGDGSVILILDPHEIYLLSTSKASTANESGKQQLGSGSGK